MEPVTRIVAVALGQSFYGGLFRSSLSRPLSSFLADILHACSGDPRILTLSGSPHEVRRTSKLLPALINAPPYKSIMRFIVIPWRGFALAFCMRDRWEPNSPCYSESLPFSKKRDSSPWWIAPISFVRSRKYRGCFLLWMENGKFFETRSRFNFDACKVFSYPC